MNPPKILTICGSLRAASYNATLLSASETEITRLGATPSRYADLADLPHYNEDLDTPETVPPVIADLRVEFAAADAVIIASPTYNHSIPGGLKDYLDWASRPYGKSVLVGKPIAILAASTGSTGGAAGAKYLEEIVALLGAKVVHPITTIAKVGKALTEEGALDAPTRGAVVATTQALVLAARGAEIVDNTQQSRFELRLNGDIAGVADYVITSDGDNTIVEMPHTQTESAFRGQGIASVLVRGALDNIAAAQRQVLPTCPFVSDFIANHDSYAHLLIE